MKKNKRLLAILLGGMTAILLCCTAVSAAPAKNATYSVDAQEIEYDMKSGDGTATGKTTIIHDGGVAVAGGGATFNSREQTGRLYGGVKADKEDSHLQSDELIMYSRNYVSAVGSAVMVKGDKTLKAPRVDYHDDKHFAETLGGYAHFSVADGSWLSAGKIIYDMKTGIANATGGVNLASPAQNMAGSADRAVYDSHETGYIELIGNAKVSRDGNTVTGNKLRVTNLKGPDSRTRAQGNVRIVYYQPANQNKEASGDSKLLAENRKKAVKQKPASQTEVKTA